MNKVLLSLGVLAVIVVSAGGTYIYEQQRVNELVSENERLTRELNEARALSLRGSQGDEQLLETTTYTSGKGVKILVTAPLQSSKVVSPLTVSGSVPGSWSQEGQFIVRMLDGDGNKIGERAASLDGNWMTESLVPFTASLMFTVPSTGQGSLVLVKANPSGLPENDDSVVVLPITF